MLVVIAILLGLIVGIIAAVLASVHGPESAVFSGAGAFVAASLFAIKIESTLRLSSWLEPLPAATSVTLAVSRASLRISC
jgi:uncharacterized membrane protein YhhN